MEFTLTIELGNDAMQTGQDILGALLDSMKGEDELPLETGVAGLLWDRNGNTVGRWEVSEDKPARVTLAGTKRL